jgi:hypothetical protein
MPSGGGRRENLRGPAQYDKHQQSFASGQHHRNLSEDHGHPENELFTPSEVMIIKVFCFRVSQQEQQDEQIISDKHREKDPYPSDILDRHEILFTSFSVGDHVLWGCC